MTLNSVLMLLYNLLRKVMKQLCFVVVFLKKKKKTPPNKIATLPWWGGLRAPVSLRAMLAGPLGVLSGSPMPDRSKVRGQTKSNLPVLQVWGFCTGLTTLSYKKPLLRKQQRVTYMNHLCRTSLRNPCHGQQ